MLTPTKRKSEVETTILQVVHSGGRPVVDEKLRQVYQVVDGAHAGRRGSNSELRWISRKVNFRYDLVLILETGEQVDDEWAGCLFPIEYTKTTDGNSG